MKIKTIGVVGAGTMGGGIAQVAVMKGFSVLLYDVNQELVDMALNKFSVRLDKQVADKKINAAKKAAILESIIPTTELEAFSHADFVIESVVEKLAVKKEVFAKLDRFCRPEVIFVTNTSSMSITEIASATGRPERVAGMHFFIPPTVMDVVEITRGYYSSDETIATVKGIAEQMEKKYVEVKKDTPGFIANRVYTPLLLEAFRVYEEGIASKEDIDAAMKLAYKLPIGPFELADYIGLDTLQSGLEYFQGELGPRWSPTLGLKRLVKAGRLGKKVGKGWYDY
ncbi:MAG: 3-hydroxybutyryl-CoA dehydrogenase [Firmicutes bacterium]|nr:3-hydroxybutyryl-CoA dehydrogenase [Bacillota bacterium]